jgi:hypothetical protein
MGSYGTPAPVKRQVAAPVWRYSKCAAKLTAGTTGLVRMIIIKRSGLAQYYNRPTHLYYLSRLHET